MKQQWLSGDTLVRSQLSKQMALEPPADAGAESEVVATGDLVGLEAGAPVSDAQLRGLVGKEDQEVEAFWLKCSSRQQQLWKKIEKKRMEEGSESAYKRQRCRAKKKGQYLH